MQDTIIIRTGIKTKSTVTVRDFISLCNQWT